MFFAGVAYQVVFGLIVIWVRVQPIIVSLSGYLALSGINLVILPRPGGIAPEWMGVGRGNLDLLASPSSWSLRDRRLAYLFDHRLLRPPAADGFRRAGGLHERREDRRRSHRRACRVCGLFAGLAALSLYRPDQFRRPTQGTTYTLISVTALVLGGTSLAGGRATVFGSLLGALNLFLIGYVLSTFDFGTVQGFVTDLCYGLILVLSLLLTLALPYLQRWLRYVSPLIVFVVLGPRSLRRRACTRRTTIRTLPAGRAQGHTPGPMRRPGAACRVVQAAEVRSCARRFSTQPRSSRSCCSPLSCSLRLLVWQANQRSVDAAALCSHWNRRRAWASGSSMDTHAFVSKLGRERNMADCPLFTPLTAPIVRPLALDRAGARGAYRGDRRRPRRSAVDSARNM